MSAIEDRVRDALRADAETVCPDTLPGVPERPTRPASGWASVPRFRILLPLGAAAAVAAIVAGVALIAPQARLPGSGVSVAPALPMPVLGTGGRTASRGVPASAPLPGVPQYYVTVESSRRSTGFPNSLVVRTVTGLNLFLVLPTGGASFTAVAGTAGDQTFVTAATLKGSSCPARSALYQVQLDTGSAGLPRPLTPLNISIPGSFNQTGSLAVTPDGRTIAYDTWLCGQNRSEVGVIDLVSGKVRAWEVPGQGPSATVRGLSLSGDGNLLAYERASGGAAILRTNAPSGSLFQHSTVVSSGAAWAALSADGATLYTCRATPAPQTLVGSVTYNAQSTGGSGQRVIASWSYLPYPRCWASLEPAGDDYLLVQYPAAVNNDPDWVQPAVLDARTGQLTRIPNQLYRGPLDVAW